MAIRQLRKQSLGVCCGNHIATDRRLSPAGHICNHRERSTLLRQNWLPWSTALLPAGVDHMRILVLLVTLLASGAAAEDESADVGIKATQNREVIRSYIIAAEKGDAQSQLDLGNTYSIGAGVAQDEVEAVRWYHLAAEQGNHEAQYNLGYHYYEGIGARQLRKEAARWYRLAAEQGNREAQLDLGVMYDKGIGVPQDYKEAIKWYRLAAERYQYSAAQHLGNLYYEGKGISQDYVQSHKWFNLAGASGNEDAREKRDIVAKQMTSEQIDEAQRLAREWMEAHP